MAYGNTSVSSLLRAAKAAQAKQYSLEDSIAAYEYDLSPKTQEAFNKYSAHLENRIKQHQGTDPLKALNYQKTITSANRSFTSSELSRATTQVLYGNMDAGAKLNTMMQLYQRAVENGDENLAQRIEGQAASLQNSMARAGGGGGYGGGRGSSADPQVKGWKTAKGEFDNYIKNLEQKYRDGSITSKEFLGGYKDKNGVEILGLQGAIQNLESIRKDAEGYISSGQGDEDAMNFYSDLSGTLSSEKYQNFMNLAGQRIEAGQPGGTRVYDYNTGQYKFEPMKTNDIRGYVNTPGGQIFKMKDESKDNIVLPDMLNGEDTGYKVNLRKNQLNQVSELRDGQDVKLQQYEGYLPGKQFANVGAMQFGNGMMSPLEMIYTQDAEGKTTGVEHKLKYFNPITGELNRDANTGELRAFDASNPQIMGSKYQGGGALGGIKAKFGEVQDDALMEAQNNPALAKAIDQQNMLGATYEYGKTKVDKLFKSKALGDLKKKGDEIAKSLGINWRPSSPGGGSMANTNWLQKQVNNLEGLFKEKQTRDAAEARARAAADAAAFQATLARTQERNRPAPVAPFRAPKPVVGNTAQQINMGFTEDPFSRAGLGTNSLYRL